MSLEWEADGLVGHSRAMASPIVIRASAPHPSPDIEAATRAALSLFDTVEDVCTRFRPESPLMRANRHPDRWTFVPPILFTALLEASWAYQRTHGRFDPRILMSLIALGYGASFSPAQSIAAPPIAVRAVSPLRAGPWRPRFRYSTGMVRLGRLPVDLGGIGKGLAVRWASRVLTSGGAVGAHLIEAGGDCFCLGTAPDGQPWRIGVENPRGGDEPIAVLTLQNLACATSSTRLRQWRVGTRTVHHLLNPATGAPGGSGLAAVTVVHRDAALAEVWSKTLFLEGAARIASLAQRRGICALWVDRAGRMQVTPSMERFVLWKEPEK